MAKKASATLNMITAKTQKKKKKNPQNERSDIRNITNILYDYIRGISDEEKKTKTI